MTDWDGGFCGLGSGVLLGDDAVGLPVGVDDGCDESLAVGVDESVGVADALDDGDEGGGVWLIEVVGSRPGGDPEFFPGGKLPVGGCDPLGSVGVGEPGVPLPDPPGSVGVPVSVGVSVPVGVSVGDVVGEVVSVGTQVGTSVGASLGGTLSTGSPPGPGCSAWPVESVGAGDVTGELTRVGGQAGSSCAPAPRPGNTTARKTPAASQSAATHSPLSRLRRVIRPVDPLCPPWPADQGSVCAARTSMPNEPTVPTVRPLLAPPEQDSPA